MNLLQPIFAHIENAERYRSAWQLRKEGATFKKIGQELGVCGARANQIVAKAERRMTACANEYDHAVNDPIAYGVWHEFTPEGRVAL